MILRTLTKIIHDRAQGIVVVPLWSAQPWFSMFTEMLESEPIIFQPHPNLLLSPYRDAHHPLSLQKLTLVAGVLSGQHIEEETYLTQLQT